MKTAVLVNPAAGRGRARKIWPDIKNKIEKWCSGFETHFTDYRGHAAALAAKLESHGVERIIVVGGDGTLHEVVNGLTTGNVVLGIIPAGTGNDFCRSLGIPRTPERAATLMEAFQEIRVDLGRVNGEFFTNVAGLGFDAQVAGEINRNFRWLSGTPAYLLAVIKSLFSFQTIPLKIVLDDTMVLELNSFLIAVGNAQYYGGGMRIVPAAIIDDGYFHLCVAGDVGKHEVLLTLPKIFSGRHMEHPLVREYRARKVEISSERRAAVHADGELVTALPACFEIMPARMRMLAP